MRLTSDDIFYLNELNSASGANAKDCVVDGNVVAFLVKGSELGKAIGKNAVAVKRLRQKIRKNIEIFEHCESAQDFIRKALYGAKVKGIKIEETRGKKRAVVALEPESKRKLLNSLPRIKRIKALLKRNYKVDDLRLR